MDVLVGLENVDWSKLHHAHGWATDVPDLLRALASDDSYVRKHAHGILIESIVHQYTIYDASIETIPFLVQLLDAPNVNNSAPLDLLEHISFGGMDRPDLRERTRQKLKEVLPTFIKHLNHPDIVLRLNAIDHLLLYSNELAQVVPPLQNLIEKDENFRIRLASLKSLAFLWIYDGETNKKLSESEVSYIAKLMRDTGYPLPLRLEAACILLGNNPEIWLEETSNLFYEVMNIHRSTLKELWKLSIGDIFYGGFQSLIQYPETNLQWVMSLVKHPKREVREQVAHRLEQLFIQGLPLEKMLPTLQLLMRDVSPEVRKEAIMFFIPSPHEKIIRDIEGIRSVLEDIAKNDIQSSVRTLATNVLNQTF